MITLVFLLILILMGLAFHVMPASMRKDVFFAVTVKPEFSQRPEALRIVHRYHMGIWIAAIGCAAVSLVAGASRFSEDLGVALVLLYALICTFLVVLGKRAASKYAVRPTGIREADLTARVPRLPGGTIAASGPYLLLAGLSFYVSLNLGILPAEFPIHWSWSGPDKWLRSNPRTVYGLLLFILLACLALSIVALSVIKGMRRIYHQGRLSESELRSRRVSAGLLIIIQYLLVLVAWIDLAPGISQAARAWMIFGCGLVGLAAAIAAPVVLIHYGQIVGPSTNWTDQAADGAPIGDRTPDECWKWGLFYYNPADPAIIVEKRFGFGQTLNFGNAWSWAIIGLLILPLLVLWILLR